MANFIGFLQGKSRQVSRLGHKTTGIRAIVRGWNIGGEMEMKHNPETKQDELWIYVDKGSTNTQRKYLQCITEKQLDEIFAS